MVQFQGVLRGLGTVLSQSRWVSKIAESLAFPIFSDHLCCTPDLRFRWRLISYMALPKHHMPSSFSSRKLHLPGVSCLLLHAFRLWYGNFFVLLLQTPMLIALLVSCSPLPATFFPQQESSHLLLCLVMG